MEHKIITIEAGEYKRKSNASLHETRKAIVDARTANDKAVATIFVQGFNRLDKTKECVESILKHTADVEYRLLLVNSGSTDGTVEYFKTVPHENTIILDFPQNISSAYTQSYFYPYIEGRYLVQVNNDIIVMPRWLSNLIKCAESDIRIGMVNPVSSNVSNLQQIDLEYSNAAEMEAAAEKFNVSNKTLWEERLRLITLGSLYKRECLEAIGYLFDTGFAHDFADDDISYRIRRAGYRLMLAKDTWVHHNHDFRNLEDKTKDDFATSLGDGKKSFAEKYFGVDSWDDFININISSDQITSPKKSGACALGIDCRVGYPLMSLKNILTHKGANEVVLSAYDQDSKFYTDLSSFCTGIVACDREEFITNHFAENQFDYVIVGRPINEFHEPYKLLQDIARLSTNGAQLVLTLTNTFGTQTLEYIKTSNACAIKSYALQLPLELVSDWLASVGYGTGNIEPQYPFESQAQMDSELKKTQALCKALSCKNMAASFLAGSYTIIVTLKK